MKRRKQPSEFVNYCRELIENCGVIGVCYLKPMMGGWAISIEEYNFAFIVDLGNGEELWLKANEETKKYFEELGCSRFTYLVTHKNEKVERSLNYYSAPSDALESYGLIREYIQLALTAALSAKKKNKR